MRAALVAASVPAARLARFDACGAASYVEVSGKGDRHRIRGFFCGDRFCVPCQRSYAARRRRAIAALADGKFLRLVTLTLRARQVPMEVALDDLLSFFQKLRKTATWKAAVKGGVGVVEIKRGKGSDLWHPHIHCVVHGYWIDAGALSRAWKAITGGSTNVKVEAVRDEERAGFYVAKYLGKGFDRSVLTDHDDLTECIRGLGGRRLLVTFGDWYNSVGDDQREPESGWRLVGGLHGIILAAERGEEWARGVLLSLRLQRGGLIEAEPPPHPASDLSIEAGPAAAPS